MPAMIHTGTIGPSVATSGAAASFSRLAGPDGRGLIVGTPGRIDIASRRHALGGGLRIACGRQQQAFPAGYLRRGAGRRGLCRRLADQADRRKRPERRSWRGGLAAVAGAVSRANARMIDSGSQFAVGWRAPTSASRLSAVGRCLGVLRQAAFDQRPHFARHPIRSGVAVDHAVQQRRRGPSAEQALASSREGEDSPRAEDVARRPDFVTGGLLGDMNPGKPITRPTCVSAVNSTAREMPKSMTCGPSSASSTFDGLRSRCTTPPAAAGRR